MPESEDSRTPIGSYRPSATDHSVMLRRATRLLLACTCLAAVYVPAALPQTPARNVIIFVADGLRSASVNADDAPTMSTLRERGVSFTNSHALFPTFTTPNASALATGHYLGDTGDFSNSLYIGFPIFNDGRFPDESSRSYTPFIEDDHVIADLDAHFEGANFLGEDTLLAAARRGGYNTAAIGKLGPAAIQDVSLLNPRDGQLPEPQTIIIDDSTGSAAGVPLSKAVVAALTAAGLQTQAPVRQQPQGSLTTPGTDRANVAQQHFFVDATTLAVLPLFKRSAKPFVVVYWSRDPDGTQHNQGDSLNHLQPGINGGTSRLGVRNADANLRQILDYIETDPALAANTDIFVTADHGFATISKHELDTKGTYTRSYSTQFTYRGADGKPDVNTGWLPPGFLAIDLAHLMKLPLFDPDTLVSSGGVKSYAPVDPTGPMSTASVRQHPARGHGLIGGSGRVLDRTDAKVIVAANGGSDLVYVLDKKRSTVAKIVNLLTTQDYLGALFVDSSFGHFAGTLPLSSIALEGGARLPRPTLVVNFKSFATDVQRPLLTPVQIADTPLQEGQGMHGTLSRDNTFNFMAAIGPDFKPRFEDTAPVSNADVAVTLAHVLGLNLPGNGKLSGRVISEILVGGPAPVHVEHKTLVSTPDRAHHATVLWYQQLDQQKYFDSACFAPVSAAGESPASATVCAQ
jgi:hypothetical protein